MPAPASLSPRRESARRETAAIHSPHLFALLDHLRANPQAAISAKDFGEVRYLTKCLEDCFNLTELHAAARDLALDILDIRCAELVRLRDANPNYELSPCDTGVVKERNRILDYATRAERKQAAAELAALEESRIKQHAPQRALAMALRDLESKATRAASMTPASHQSGHSLRPATRQPSSHSSASPLPSLPSPKPLGGQAKRRLKAQLHEQRKAQRLAARAAEKAATAQKLQPAAA